MRHHCSSSLILPRNAGVKCKHTTKLASHCIVCLLSFTIHSCPHCSVLRVSIFANKYISGIALRTIMLVSTEEDCVPPPI